MATQGAVEPSKDHGRSIRVLWVGAEAGTAALAEELGERHDAVEVEREGDFATALEVVRDGTIDCVVSDHRQSGIDGVRVLEEVRSRYPALPVFLVPEDGDEAVAARAVEADATGYVPADADDRTERLGRLVLDAVPGTTGAENGRTPIRGRRFEEEFRLKERVLDEAPIGITISDADREDMPLIYVNEAFVETTGYEKEEALGVNCRFLQGPGTDETAVCRVREAIENEEEVSVELRNYRRDGSEFWNRLDITPIRDENGDVTCFAGFQRDITELKRVQEDLEERRRQLERVLDRIDDLVRDASEILIQSDTEEEVTGSITRRLTDDEYDLAWMGWFDPATESIPVVEYAGNRADPRDDRIDLDDGTPLTGTILEAIETAETEVLDATDAVEDPLFPEAGSSDEPTRIVVPLTYRNVTYGVIVIHVGDREPFEHETAILSAIGRTIGSAINAIRSKRTALSDTVIQVAVEIEGETFLGDVAATVDSIDFESLVERPGDGRELLLAVGGADPSELEELAGSTDSIDDVETLVEHEDRSVLQFETTGVELLDLLTEHGGRLTDVAIGGSGVRIRFEASEEDGARSVLDGLREHYAAVDLVEYHESDRTGLTEHGLGSRIERRLTDRQHAAIRKAHAAGFFEWPRRVDGDELADSMGIVPSTFHQHLRAAERKMLDEIFE